jgi:hypothetical protein
MQAVASKLCGRHSFRVARPQAAAWRAVGSSLHLTSWSAVMGGAVGCPRSRRRYVPAAAVTQPTAGNDGPSQPPGSNKPGGTDGGGGGDAQPVRHLTTLLHSLRVCAAAYALWLVCVALCGVSVDQYMQKMVPAIPGHQRWRLSVILPVCGVYDQ